MKLRRLPEIDLARACVRKIPDRKVFLEQFTRGGGSWSYKPAQSRELDIFGATDPLGMMKSRVPLEAVEKAIRAQCKKGEKETLSNIEVSRLLYNWVTDYVSRSVERSIPSMGIGSLGRVRYWSNVVAEVQTRPTFFFHDYRRSGGLNESSRRFVFSLMHEQIRVPDPDFWDANLVILQYPQSPGSPRSIVPYSADGIELIGIDELQDVVSETYTMYEAILRSKAA